MRDTRLKSYIALVDSFMHIGHEALTFQAWMRQSLSNLWRQSTTDKVVRTKRPRRIAVLHTCVGNRECVETYA